MKTANKRRSESMMGNTNRTGYEASNKTKRKIARSMKRLHKQRRLNGNAKTN